MVNTENNQVQVEEVITTDTKGEDAMVETSVLDTVQEETNSSQVKSETVQDSNKVEQVVTQVPKKNNQKQKKVKSVQTQQKKPVDLSRLLNLGDQIAENHMKASDRPSNSPGNFKRFVPNIKNDVIETVKHEDEGKKHINISYASSSNLGKLLDLYAPTPFTTPEAGSFHSIGGLQDYLKSDQDPKFRTTSGRTGREAGEPFKTRTVKGMQQILADATWFKIIQNDKLLNGLLNTDLPLYSYYLSGGKVVMTSLNTWYVPVINEIRRVIKLNDENIKASKAAGIDNPEVVYPDFSFLDRSKKK